MFDNIARLAIRFTVRGNDMTVPGGAGQNRSPLAWCFSRGDNAHIRSLKAWCVSREGQYRSC